MLCCSPVCDCCRAFVGAHAVSAEILSVQWHRAGYRACHLSLSSVSQSVDQAVIAESPIRERINQLRIIATYVPSTSSTTSVISVVGGAEVTWQLGTAGLFVCGRYTHEWRCVGRQPFCFFCPARLEISIQQLVDGRLHRTSPERIGANEAEVGKATFFCKKNCYNRRWWYIRIYRVAHICTRV